MNNSLDYKVGCPKCSPLASSTRDQGLQGGMAATWQVLIYLNQEDFAIYLDQFYQGSPPRSSDWILGVPSGYVKTVIEMAVYSEFVQ